MSSVASEFRAYLIAGGLMTDDNSYVSRAPTVDLSGSDQWAIAQQPGSKSGGNILQWKRTYNMLVLFRHKDGEQLYERDDDLQALLEDCVDLPSYKILRCIANPMSELELNAKEVHVGQWAITLELVKK